jgi:hypothetical protein
MLSRPDESRNDSFLSVRDALEHSTALTDAETDIDNAASATSRIPGGNNACTMCALEGERKTHVHSCARSTPDASTGWAIRKSFKGDIGLTLFSPLVLADLPASSAAAGSTGPDSSSSAPALQPVRSRSDSDLNEKCNGPSRERVEMNHDDICAGEPVPLADEDADVLRSSPRLLNPVQMRRIRDEGLHSTAKIMRWHRPYSLSRDGDSFRTMMEKCGGYRHTIVVCRTSDGDVLGGYADEAWKLGGTSSFFGGGRAFLFATRPDLSGIDRKRTFAGSGGRSTGFHVADKGSNAVVKAGDEADDSEDPSIYVFPWTGTNTYSQVCNVECEQLAMGGGGSFGFIVQEHFSKGSTGPCATFNNPRLIRDPSGCFEIVDFEVYGLKSCLFEGSFSSERMQSRAALRNIANAVVT